MLRVNNRGRAALLGVLHGLGGHAAVGADRGGGTVDVRYQDSSSVLLPVWAGEGYPQDVKRALQDLDHAVIEPGATPVVAVRRLSTGAEAMLRERGVSWVDEDGRAMISASPALLVVRDRPSPPLSDGLGAPTDRRHMRWAAGGGAIAEYLLARRASRREADRDHALPPVERIAGVVGVSPGLVSRVLQDFDSQGWTEKSGAARGSSASRALQDPAGMLSSWAAWHSGRRVKTVRAHAAFQDARAFIHDRVEPSWPVEKWAITGWLALEVRAPWTTSIPSIAIYVDPELVATPADTDHLLESAGLRRVDRGARVIVLPADRFVLRPVALREPFPLVSDIRLYGDLLREGARGPDAADHLRETRIGF